ncbi:MAG TPA: M20/M25/M40 family metallo-hydrolase [Desulfopila sp.]|nr:M20/M25/M40 family metallo-hydrolase [Desulfopila sp.]
MQINQERLAGYFTELCVIESPSGKEGRVADYLRRRFTELGVDAIDTDDSMEATGSETGNIIFRLAGDQTVGEPVFFACHMDTVGPTEGGINVVRLADRFTSDGETVLGADDKSGIAPLLEMLAILRENNIRHCPMELVFTTCEEIGLRGAKAMAPDFISAPYGYALDSTSKGSIITGAPAANRIKVRIRGQAAHSGLAPEAGTNALALAARALDRLTLGRLDSISTANFGLISGGTAINIVPEIIDIEGEVRSHSQGMLESHSREIERVFTIIADHWPHSFGRPPSVTVSIEEEFPLMRLEDDAPVLRRIAKSAGAVGFPLAFDIAGGGSDANIFCNHGRPTAIIPTGMSNVHSTQEYVDLADMVRLTELLLAMVTS